ncbi:response regulator [Psychrobacillus sp. OK032]|uniref:response regulator transcription factor n=1 Tax=Psychrobacillus sp. OK032 TaxID=1884358 RepID=UPI0008D6E926|nr:response regulator [Psychrobacillus sp. OK032]SER56940.1 two component transcriptional regulator, AraC family [Psychrobacillus sp. OK032]
MKRVLLVDDERWVRKALMWSIRKLNLSLQIVHECANGLEALDWIKQNDVDLVLTDIRMPVMDGLTLVKELNKLDINLDCIVISVHDEFQIVQQAIRSGVTDYLLKPIEEEELRGCLEKWLNKQKDVGEEFKTPTIVDDVLPASTIDQVLAYLEKTPLKQVSLTDAARSVHLNPSYLSQLFKQQLNTKFVDYLTELRIQEGKRLLLNTTLKMSEIAERVGYSEVAYFSNNFKKMTGYSPSEFRKSTKTKKSDSR